MNYIDVKLTKTSIKVSSAPSYSGISFRFQKPTTSNLAMNELHSKLSISVDRYDDYVVYYNLFLKSFSYSSKKEKRKEHLVSPKAQTYKYQSQK